MRGSRAATSTPATSSSPAVGDAPTAAAQAAKVANAREALQRALLAKVKPQCEALGVEVRAVTLADMRPPAELADQIAQRELARVEQEKNAVRLRQYRAEQELKAKEALKEQAKEKVEAETRLIQAKTKAEQLKEVASSQLKQELENAQLAFDAAEKQAEATLAKGKAEAAVINLQNEAEVAGLRKAVQGFASVQTFAQYHLMNKLGPALDRDLCLGRQRLRPAVQQLHDPAAGRRRTSRRRFQPALAGNRRQETPSETVDHYRSRHTPAQSRDAPSRFQ